MRFSFEQLEAFVTTAQERSFSAAARRLRKAQSAVSTAVINLEVDLGVTLFDRSGRYPVLSPEGQALMCEAEAVLLHCASLQGRANNLNRDVEPRLVIAVDDAIPYAAIAGSLRRFEAEFPDLELEIQHPSQGDILHAVQCGEVMLGLTFAQSQYPSEIAFRRLGHINLTHAVHRDHPLAKSTGISFAQLSDYRQIVVKHGRKLPTGEYLKAPRCWFVESYLMLLEAASDGLGWVTLPKRLIANKLASGELVELRLEAYPFTEWTVGTDLIWNTAAQSGKAAIWLRTALSSNEINV
ncbi:LysR family transcriptional regulator [Paraburkholderia sp. BCC1884]|uniref:LysR family transcriptional regulator n=1 Tax=Paraburkholderia sp. BCC1884 TaxID=2562668 RepID=UPI0011825F2C|nr:LysR family transcriptional regulator [Paraburkholderia sp. BCC1884]